MYKTKTSHIGRIGDKNSKILNAIPNGILLFESYSFYPWSIDEFS